MSDYSELLAAAENCKEGKEINFTNACRKTAIKLLTELEKQGLPLPELGGSHFENSLYLHWEHHQSVELSLRLEISKGGRCVSWEVGYDETKSIEGWVQYIEECLKPHPFYSLPKATSGIEGYMLIQCGYEGIEKEFGIFSKEEVTERLKVLRERPHDRQAETDSYCVQLINSDGCKCVCGEIEGPKKEGKLWLY